MPELDDLLNPTTGREVAARAGDAAQGSEVDLLARRGVRRARRATAGGIAGVAAATAIAVGIGAGVAGNLSAQGPPVDAPRPDGSETTPVEDRPLADLSPEEVTGHPRASAPTLAFGPDPDTRLAFWSARQDGACREVVATTTDDGATWIHQSLPDPGCGSLATIEVLGDGQAWAVARYWADREVVVVRTDGTQGVLRPERSTGPLAPDEALLPMGRDQTTVAVAPDGSARLVGWRRPSTAVVESRDPTGRVVSQGVGAQLAVDGGLCCYTGAAVRWSDDGGATFAQYRLADGSAEPGAVDSEFGLMSIPDSYDPDTLAAVEGGETNRGPGTGGDLTYDGVHRSTDGGATWERLALLPEGGSVDVAWSLVEPDGGLLLWHDRQGLLRTDGADWTALDPVPVDPDVGPLGALLDHREVDGTLQLVVRSRGEFLRSGDGGETWTAFDPVG